MIDSSHPRRGEGLRAALREDPAMPAVLATALINLANDLTKLQDLAQVAALQERAKVLLAKVRHRSL